MEASCSQKPKQFFSMQQTVYALSMGHCWRTCHRWQKVVQYVAVCLCIFEYKQYSNISRVICRNVCIFIDICFPYLIRIKSKVMLSPASKGRPGSNLVPKRSENRCWHDCDAEIQAVGMVPHPWARTKSKVTSDIKHVKYQININAL